MRKTIRFSEFRRLAVEFDSSDPSGDIYIYIETRSEKDHTVWLASAKEFASCDLLSFVKLVMSLQDFEKQIIGIEGE